jgi:hypothetical protein
MPVERHICEACGGQLDAEKLYCPFCGTKARIGGASIVAGGSRACHKCSAANSASERYCRNCGTLITRMCPSCKTLNGMDRNTCIRCGDDLHATHSLITPDEIRKLLESGDYSDAEAAAARFIDVYGFTEEGLVLAAYANYAWGNSLVDTIEFRNMCGKRLRRARYYVDKYRKLYPDGSRSEYMDDLDEEISFTRTKLIIPEKKNFSASGIDLVGDTLMKFLYVLVIILVIVFVVSIIRGS